MYFRVVTFISNIMNVVSYFASQDNNIRYNVWYCTRFTPLLCPHTAQWSQSQ